MRDEDGDLRIGLELRHHSGGAWTETAAIVVERAELRELERELRSLLMLT